MKLREYIGKKFLFFDGAMGTLLQEEGLSPFDIPEHWNIEKPDLIKKIHREYFDAGCNIIKSNTFGANKIKLDSQKYTIEELIKSAINLGKEAAKESGKRDTFVVLDISSTGKLLKPLGELPFEDAYEAFKEMVVAGEKAGADGILLETFTNSYELKAAVLAAKENSSLPIFASVMVDEKGKLLTGNDIPSIVALLEGLGVDAIGLNCGFGPEQMFPFLKEMSSISSIPIFSNPNAGLPKLIDDKTIFEMKPDQFVSAMEEISTLDPWLMGGCCGTTPNHLNALIERFKEISPKEVEEKNISFVSSYTHAVTLGEAPIIIGEKINPTGNKEVASAIKEKNYGHLISLGSKEKKAGAHILDVNLGVAGTDEEHNLPLVIEKLQEVINTPLMLDSSNEKAIEKAARIYNGKPIINSVNGKKESMKKIFPIAAKYGAVVLGLTLDESGIPKTPEERLAIAKKIIDCAASYGIKKKDIIIDALTMTISTGAEAAAITLDSIKLIKNQLGVNTVLGVSNISHGLPCREKLNASFYNMALQKGLSAGIIDPFSNSMMDTYFTFNALAGIDKNSLAYIGRYKEVKKNKKETSVTNVTNSWGEEIAKGENINIISYKNDLNPLSKEETFSDANESFLYSPLYEAIINGLKEDAIIATNQLIKNDKPLDIINTHIVPALDHVGAEYESGELFLPQLLISAESASNAFEVLKKLIVSDEKSNNGKIILATVKGDIHDIGKNIVKVLLESYGYNVIDLGKDVEPDLIVTTAIEQGVTLIGLSALMTTTVPYMESTIKKLQEANVKCQVVVGGAVVTEEYAKSIHANFYAKDAMATVQIAEEVL